MKTCAALRLATASILFAMTCAAGAAEEPEAVYAKFHRALQSGNLADLNKYGTASGAAEMAKLPADQRKAMLDMLKKLLPQSYSITGKEASPDGNRMVMRATGMGTGLLSGKPETQYGTITLLKQGGEWKVQESSWDGTKPPASSGRAAAPAAPMAATPVPAPAAPRPAVAKAAPAATPKAAAPAAAPTSAPVLGAGKPSCAYKPVMTDEEIARCR